MSSDDLKFGSNNPDDLRDLGLRVAVHSDYSLDGLRMTLWLLTWVRSNPRSVESFRGEAGSDAEALDIIREQVKARL